MEIGYIKRKKCLGWTRLNVFTGINDGVEKFVEFDDFENAYIFSEVVKTKDMIKKLLKERQIEVEK